MIREVRHGLSIGALSQDAQPFPVGDWLTLKSRAASDPDLALAARPGREAIPVEAEAKNRARSNAAKSALASGRAERRLASCEATAPLLAHLDPAEQKSLAFPGRSARVAACRSPRNLR